MEHLLHNPPLPLDERHREYARSLVEMICSTEQHLEGHVQFLMDQHRTAGPALRGAPDTRIADADWQRRLRPYTQFPEATTPDTIQQSLLEGIKDPKTIDFSSLASVTTEEGAPGDAEFLKALRSPNDLLWLSVMSYIAKERLAADVMTHLEGVAQKKKA